MLDRPVFTVRGAAYTWQDVAGYARLRGDWEAIEREAAAGAAALAVEPAREAVAEAAQAWRRERRLLAADDLGTWLERRGLNAESWLACMRRTVAHSLSQFEPRVAVDEQDTWAEAMCSGRLDECARTRPAARGRSRHRSREPRSCLRGVLRRGRQRRSDRTRDRGGPPGLDPGQVSPGGIRRAACRCRVCAPRPAGRPGIRRKLPRPPARRRSSGRSGSRTPIPR